MHFILTFYYTLHLPEYLIDFHCRIPHFNQYSLAQCHFILLNSAIPLIFFLLPHLLLPQMYIINFLFTNFFLPISSSCSLHSGNWKDGVFIYSLHFQLNALDVLSMNVSTWLIYLVHNFIEHYFQIWYPDYFPFIVGYD